MTSHGSEHDPSVQTMLETERHRRIVAEERYLLLDGRIHDAERYLDSLTADTPLKANVLRILRGE